MIQFLQDVKNLVTSFDWRLWLLPEPKFLECFEHWPLGRLLPGHGLFVPMEYYQRECKQERIRLSWEDLDTWQWAWYLELFDSKIKRATSKKCNGFLKN